MIRILKSENRNPEYYKMLADLLSAGMNQYCTNDCDNCTIKPICSSVYSAIGYSLHLYETTNR